MHEPAREPALGLLFADERLKGARERAVPGPGIGPRLGREQRGGDLVGELEAPPSAAHEPVRAAERFDAAPLRRRGDEGLALAQRRFGLAFEADLDEQVDGGREHHGQRGTGRQGRLRVDEGRHGRARLAEVPPGEQPREREGAALRDLRPARDGVGAVAVAGRGHGGEVRPARARDRVGLAAGEALQHHARRLQVLRFQVGERTVPIGLGAVLALRVALHDVVERRGGLAPAAGEGVHAREQETRGGGLRGVGRALDDVRELVRGVAVPALAEERPRGVEQVLRGELVAAGGALAVLRRGLGVARAALVERLGAGAAELRGGDLALRALGALERAERVVGAARVGEHARAHVELLRGERVHLVERGEQLRAAVGARLGAGVEREPPRVARPRRRRRVERLEPERAGLLFLLRGVLAREDHTLDGEPRGVELAGALVRERGLQPRVGPGRGREVVARGVVGADLEGGLRAGARDGVAQQRELVLEPRQRGERVGVAAERERDPRRGVAVLRELALALRHARQRVARVGEARAAERVAERQGRRLPQLAVARGVPGAALGHGGERRGGRVAVRARPLGRAVASAADGERRGREQRGEQARGRAFRRRHGIRLLRGGRSSG